MKTPFTNKGDMVSEIQTAKHYIETLAHHSYSIGFADGCRYCEKGVYERVLNIIDEDIGEHIFRDSFKSREDLTKLYDRVRSHIKTLKGDEQV